MATTRGGTHHVQRVSVMNTLQTLDPLARELRDSRDGFCTIAGRLRAIEFALRDIGEVLGEDGVFLRSADGVARSELYNILLDAFAREVDALDERASTLIRRMQEEHT